METITHIIPNEDNLKQAVASYNSTCGVKLVFDYCIQYGPEVIGSRSFTHAAIYSYTLSNRNGIARAEFVYDSNSDKWVLGCD